MNTIPYQDNIIEMTGSPVFSILSKYFDNYFFEAYHNELYLGKEILVGRDDDSFFPRTHDDIVNAYATDREIVLMRTSISIEEPPVYIKLSRKTFNKLVRCHHISGTNYLYNRVKETGDVYILSNRIRSFVSSLFYPVGDADIKTEAIVIEDMDSHISYACDMFISDSIKANPSIINNTSVTLIMSEECNLRCTYCYEPGGHRNKDIMTFETAKVILNKISPSGRVTFFGGEPMMHIDLMKQIIEWGRNHKNFTYEIITNGQITDREFISRYLRYFNYVQLSIDGPESPNDINRGHGSYARAMEFMSSFYNITGRYPNPHPVLSRETIPFLFDTIIWFYELSKMMYKSNGKFSFRVLAGDSARWTEEDFKLLENAWDVIKGWYLVNKIWECKHFEIEAFAQADLYYQGALESCSCGSCSHEKDQGYSPKTGSSPFCMAGRTLFAAFPNGDMVPCHHEYWANSPKVNPVHISEDLSYVNHMSTISCSDIEKCSSCEQFGCCICPGSFYFSSREYNRPEENWCRAGKILIQKAKEYVAQKQNMHPATFTHEEKDIILSSIDYMLDKDTRDKEGV